MAAVQDGVEDAFQYLGGGASLIALLWIGINNLGLQTTLLFTLGVMISIAVYVTYRLETTVESRIEDIESRIQSGFSEVVEDYEARADGSGGWRPVIGVTVDDEEISAVPSLAGAAAGGFAGALFGPQGAIAGAILGALAGGGKEYQNLQEQHQKDLEKVAWEAYERMSSSSQFTSTMTKIEDEEMQSEKYWLFQFEDSAGMQHYVRISKDAGNVEYRPGGWSNQAKLGDLE